MNLSGPAHNNQFKSDRPLRGLRLNKGVMCLNSISMHFVRNIQFLVVITFSTSLLAAEKDSFRPFDHPYPQIIQANDFPTIAAIHALYSELNRLEHVEVLKQRVHFRVEPSKIIFCKLNGGCMVVEIPENGPIVISGQLFTANETIITFNTILSILQDSMEESDAYSIKYAQWRSRGYQRLTEIEFDLGTQVLHFSENSNGPESDERLYVVDLIDRQGSYFDPACCPEIGTDNK